MRGDTATATRASAALDARWRSPRSPPYGTIGAGSIASSSIGLPAAKNRYGVAAAFPRTTAHARPGRLYQVRNRYPRISVVAVRMAAETIDGATCFGIRRRVPKTAFRKIAIDARTRDWSAGGGG